VVVTPKSLGTLFYYKSKKLYYAENHNQSEWQLLLLHLFALCDDV